jgi:hypothetical protein
MFRIRIKGSDRRKDLGRRIRLWVGKEEERDRGKNRQE